MAEKTIEQIIKECVENKGGETFEEDGSYFCKLSERYCHYQDYMHRLRSKSIIYKGCLLKGCSAKSIEG